MCSESSWFFQYIFCILFIKKRTDIFIYIRSTIFTVKTVTEFYVHVPHTCDFVETTTVIKNHAFLPQLFVLILVQPSRNWAHGAETIYVLFGAFYSSLIPT